MIGDTTNNPININFAPFKVNIRNYRKFVFTAG